MHSLTTVPSTGAHAGRENTFFYTIAVASALIRIKRHILIIVSACAVCTSTIYTVPTAILADGAGGDDGAGLR